jgi:hypothetical protein
MGAELREIPAAQAAAPLLSGIDALLRYGPPPGTDRSDEEARWPQEERAKLAEEFLASPYARDLRDRVSRTMPLLIISSCVGQLGCDPRPIGPDLLERLLVDVLPVTAIGPDRFADLLPAVIRGWTEWRAEQNGLDGKTRKMLMFRLEPLLREFRAKWNGPRAHPWRRYVQDLPDDITCDGDKMFPAIERRTFAVPEPAERPGLFSDSRDGQFRPYNGLDAAAPADRERIARADALRSGVPPRLSNCYVAVVEQLWADDPAEAWAAAQRMQAAGQLRHKILGRLARALEQAGGPDAGPEAYAASLARLSADGRANPRAPGR